MTLLLGLTWMVADFRMLKAIYTGVDAWIRVYQARLETAILEVDPEGE